MSSPRIGLACLNPGERATLIDWCTSAKFRPAPMIDGGSIVRELEGDGFQALVIDGELASTGETSLVLRNLGRNRPVIVIIDDDRAPVDIGRRDATYLSRPIAREMFLFTLNLALGEGRPARRSPRRQVARLQASVEGAPARLIDVSPEGLRLEMPEGHRSTLPPVFNVTVPTFNVRVVGRRMWLNNAINPQQPRSFWCGVRLERNPSRAVLAWQALIENAPTSAQLDYL